jgi:2-dehydro-3-deoxy-D-arabinonate dehydratase
MQLCKVQRERHDIRVGVVEEERVRFLGRDDAGNMRTLSDVLHAGDPAAAARSWIDTTIPEIALAEARLLAPVDQQEVWAAGVTYRRSREARERESVGAARFYDLVYQSPRPELFFKATPLRVVGPGAPVRVRRDSRWTVPEPELALVLSPQLQIVGYTIGNDMSARDIEGENPLYLPQAKIYAGACALGPCITLAESMPRPEQVAIHMTVKRADQVACEGSTQLSEMARSFADLVDWLGRDNQFPHGAVLLTGTGIVPLDHFALAHDDVVSIDVTGIGRLTNPVEQQT